MFFKYNRTGTGNLVEPIPGGNKIDQRREYDGQSVTPNDGTDLPDVAQGLIAGATGTIAVNLRNGNTASITVGTANTIMPIEVTRVKATGTTATGIVALY